MADKLFHCVQCDALTKIKGQCLECKQAEKERRKARDKKRRF